METKKSLSLSGKLLVSSFILLFIDFVFYKFFGEPIEKYHSFGWYCFLIGAILCGLSFAAFWIAFVAEMRSSSKKKCKESTKRERVLRVFNKIETGSIISTVILLILSISLSAGFKIDPIEDSFKLSNPKEIIVFISEALTGLSVLVAFIAPMIRYYWFHRKKMMNEP